MLWTLEPKWTPACASSSEHDGFVGEGSAAAAVLLRHVGEQEPDRACLRPGVGIGAMLLAPAGLVRREFLLHELANALAEQPQLVVHPRRLMGQGRSWCSFADQRPTGGFGLGVRSQRLLQECGQRPPRSPVHRSAGPSIARAADAARRGSQRAECVTPGGAAARPPRCSSRAGSPGARVTSNESSGRESPSPSDLEEGLLARPAVEERPPAPRRRATAASAARSTGEKQTAGQRPDVADLADLLEVDPHLPIGAHRHRPRAPSWDRLKRGPSRPASCGLPPGPASSATSSGRTPR